MVEFSLEMLRSRHLLFVFAFALLALPARAQAPDPLAELEAFLRVPSVVGREEPGLDFIRQRLTNLPVEQDAAGNLVLTLGSGTPRRLVVCPLGEPGLIVSRIEPDGYLRVVPVGDGSTGALWAQSFEGNTVVVAGARGWVPGGVTQRSVHLMQEGGDPPDRKPFLPSQVWIDAGAESAAEVDALGIRLLDPVALLPRPVRLPGGRVAGPSSRLKGACLAMTGAARALAAKPPGGTTVFAWTTADLLNSTGLLHLAKSRGPFERVLRMSLGFGFTQEGNDVKPAALPLDGSGLLTAGEPLDGVQAPLQKAPHVTAPLPFGLPSPTGTTRR
jgi:hypothetical protein